MKIELSKEEIRWLMSFVSLYKDGVAISYYNYMKHHGSEVGCKAHEQFVKDYTRVCTEIYKKLTKALEDKESEG